ncbi:recombinase family protein [Kushneria indalinina]|uniref:DNA invertase Pin-like site-specific DNA recombinase n=1 Tax=Kushneria indalinina DSM 14324 TaxID=1122140 RepID=A0A3D9DRL2_9GAMM|nr:recombinase family protein [Kushneria indalinina]REC93393.1 DNA invertase Pin-like site-specific DNA recombinase [Kushneria indalinina DSM 14324]
MFVRAYLRGSTDEQDANRARGQLQNFSTQHGVQIASWYVENASGASIARPELSRLLNDAHDGDVILIEAIDRLSRLNHDDWRHLRGELNNKGLRVVALDLPTSYLALSLSGQAADDFTARILDAVNGMMLDTLAAVARKDYEDRRYRQQQGIEKARAEGKFKGRQKNLKLRQQIDQLLKSRHADGSGYSIREVAKVLKCSTNTVMSVKSDGV